MKVLCMSSFVQSIYCTVYHQCIKIHVISTYKAHNPLDKAQRIKIYVSNFDTDFLISGDHKDFKEAAGKTVSKYIKSVTDDQADRQTKKKIKFDTYVYPLLQMALFGVHTEEMFVKQLFRSASDGVKISLATGYFNLTKQYQNIIVVESLANFNLLIASPQVLV